MDSTSPNWRFSTSALVSMLLVALLGSLSGCVGDWPPSGPLEPEDGNLGLDPRLFPNQRIAGEPNDSFAQPLDAIFDSAGVAQLTGSISTPEDVDVYALGPLSAGDRLIIDVATHNSNLDPAVAVFDESGTLAFENDDRDFDLGLYDPFLNQAIRRDSQVYFLVIAKAPLGTRRMATGSYEVLVRVVPGSEVPAPAEQIVVLDFDGGTVEIPYDDIYTVGPFDAADISLAYAGKTAEVRDQIVSTVRENYEGLALDVRVVPGDPVPSRPSEYSAIFFGGRSPDAFGISENIDPYNQDPSDKAIVFTEMFTPLRFGQELSPEDLGIAIGNVASHELGHLLGLNHVANVYDLMDTTGEPSTFCLDQEFTSSPLDDSIFPIGTQNGLLWLLETLGPVL